MAALLGPPQSMSMDSAGDARAGEGGSVMRAADFRALMADRTRAWARLRGQQQQVGGMGVRSMERIGAGKLGGAAACFFADGCNGRSQMVGQQAGALLATLHPLPFIAPSLTDAA
ncbi:hypothetical protein HaLaN_02483, partial [Haematococcus lacustris]